MAEERERLARVGVVKCPQCGEYLILDEVRLRRYLNGCCDRCGRRIIEEKEENENG